MFQGINNNRLRSQFVQQHETLSADWRGQPSPGPIPPADWDHNITVDRNMAEYLLWKYRNTSCTLHNMTILPSGAEIFLLHQNNIRNEDEKHTETLAHEMACGRFEYTGDPIRFDTNLEMVDSHHRNKACVASGESFTANITFGLPPHVRRIVDTGQKKRGADFILRNMGVPNYSDAATICRDVISCIRNESYGRNVQRLTESELAAFYKENADAVDRAVRLTKEIGGVFTTSEVGAIFFFLIKTRNGAWAMRLAELLGSGCITKEHSKPMVAFARMAWRHRRGGDDHIPCDKIRRSLLAVFNMNVMGMKVNSKLPLEPDTVAPYGGTLNGRFPQEIASRV